MSRNGSFTTLPNVNDAVGIEAHKNAVLSAFHGTLGLIDSSLREALPKTLNTFKLLEGPVDLTLHGTLTRYLVKQALAAKRTVAVEEDDIIFELQKVANCGLCVATPLGSVRILKAVNETLPKALSDARVRFSTNDQLELQFEPGEQLEEIESLNLFVLWTMNSAGEYVGMEIACPRKVDQNGVIKCVWTTKWLVGSAQAVELMAIAEDDLEEIKALPRPAQANTKAS